MVALSFRFPHHGRYSSYHRLLDYLDPQDRAVDATIPLAVYHNRYLNWRDMAGRTWRRFKEAEAWRIANAENSRWMHYLYPEQGYYNGFSRKKKDQRILFSCHLPELVVEEFKGKLKYLVEGLRRADGIILMSPNDRSYYEEMAPQARIAFIPHGIDVHYFSPRTAREPRGSANFRVLTVGNMMRDFPRLAGVIRRAASEGLEIEFNVVAKLGVLNNLRKLVGEEAWPRVRAHHDISDEALRDLYHGCDLLFLPLLAATANNALLEAMAVGLPIFASDLPACRAYAKDCAAYFPADLDEPGLLAALGDFSSDRGRLARMAGMARMLAETELSWEVIAKRQEEFMRSFGS